MSQRRPTSADVARAAGVSRTTVSFVLNRRAGVRISPDTRRRVLEAARELGYHASAPARQLAGGSSRTLGLVLRQTPERVAADALLPETLRGLASAARDEDYRVLVEPLPPGEGTYATLLRGRHADGLVISGPRSDDHELDRLAEEGFPIILQGSLDGSPVPRVDIDNRAAARSAVWQLLALGHRDIACVTNAPPAYSSSAERVAGYREALEAHGVPYRLALVAEGDFDADSGHAAMRRILDAGELPTAVFAASDVIAFGVYGALRAAGLRIPDDVSVIGFDDIALAAYADPPLTTVHTPAFDLGQTAGRLLLEMLGGRRVPNRTLLVAGLVARASAAAPPSNRVFDAGHFAHGP